MVFLKNGEPVTNSRLIAEKFNKRHYDVLMSVDNIECSKEFSLRNFSQSEFKDSRGKIRKQYILTQDGFSFLVMGFTGRMAARFKEGISTLLIQCVTNSLSLLV